MSTRKIDTSRMFPETKFEELPDHRQIEAPEEVPVPPDNPPRVPVQREQYYPDDGLIQAVNLAIALGRPLLLQGEPGCGKTRLAHAVAYDLQLPLETCYIKSTSRARDLLYTYDAVNRLYDAQLGADGPKDKGQTRSRDVRNYIHFGPLGRAIIRATYGRRSVVLIDEIDKADLDFPNDLLLELDRLEFRVDEASQMHYKVDEARPDLRPIVFVTHNEEKALPTAFLRRCIFHYIEFPRENLRRILELHDVKDEQLAQRAVDILLKLRSLELRKRPGLSELLDWVGYLQAVNEPVEHLDGLPFIDALVKQQADQQLVKSKISAGGGAEDD